MVTSNNQLRKYAMGVAGEFLVAGELLRRGIMAAVTYGNAKKADVVAIAEGKSVSVEVKTTSASKWVLGASVPEASNVVWVLVYLPDDLSESPQYFVLTGGELRDIVLPMDRDYRERYLAKHGKPFARTGVTSVARSAVESYWGAWHTVNRFL